MAAAAGAAPEPEAAAKRLVAQLVASDTAGVVAAFDDTMRAALPEPKLREVWAAVHAQAGAFQRQEGVRHERTGAYDVVVVTCAFERARLDVRVVQDAAGRVAGLFFAPAAPAQAWAVPSYCSPGTYSERDITVGASSQWPLPGTLTVPAGPGPHAAVVLGGRR